MKYQQRHRACLAGALRILEFILPLDWVFAHANLSVSVLVKFSSPGRDSSISSSWSFFWTELLYYPLMEKFDSLSLNLWKLSTNLPKSAPLKCKFFCTLCKWIECFSLIKKKWMWFELQRWWFKWPLMWDGIILQVLVYRGKAQNTIPEIKRNKAATKHQHQHSCCVSSLHSRKGILCSFQVLCNDRFSWSNWPFLCRNAWIKWHSQLADRVTSHRNGKRFSSVLSPLSPTLGLNPQSQIFMGFSVYFSPHFLSIIHVWCN